MRPAEARRLATHHGLEELRRAAELLADEHDPGFRVDGADHGEKLTHVLLASRIRERIEVHGEEPRAAFREVMAGVRHVLTNE